MASVTIYEIVEDLFLFDGVNIDLENLTRLINTKQVSTDEQGIVNGSGFTIPNNREINELSFLDLFGFEEASYGTYNRPSIIDNQIRNTENTFQYFASCRVLIFSSNLLLIISDSAAEEKVKVGVRKLLEELGLDLRQRKMDSDFLRRLKNDDYIRVISCGICDVDNPNDSTKKLSYEIDPADVRNASTVDGIYEGTGNIIKLKVYFPYRIDDRVFNIVLTFYNIGHRGVFDPIHLNGENIENFLFVLSAYLLGI